MIIGISGGINSGKDEVANMLMGVAEPPHWELRRFADKLKDTVCLWLGCSREQLEDRDFKERPLGAEWEVFFVANMSTGERMSSKVYMSAEGPNELLNKLKRPSHLIVKNEVLTPRRLFQIVGTEGGRNIIHPNIWINTLFSDYKPVDDEYPHWVIPDTRFVNEAEAIIDRGGVLLNIIRPMRDRFPIQWSKYAMKFGTKRTESGFLTWLRRGDKIQHDLYEKLTHDSEIDLDGYTKFHYTINNDGTLEDLRNEVVRVYKDIKSSQYAY